MAVRIRKDGRIFCAAMFSAKEGDTYIHDGLHYHLSVEEKVLVTEAMSRHAIHGEWWWAGNVPSGVVIDEFYKVREGETPSPAREARALPGAGTRRARPSSL